MQKTKTERYNTTTTWADFQSCFSRRGNFFTRVFFAARTLRRKSRKHLHLARKSSPRRGVGATHFSQAARRLKLGTELRSQPTAAAGELSRVLSESLMQKEPRLQLYPSSWGGVLRCRGRRIKLVDCSLRKNSLKKILWLPLRKNNQWKIIV